MKYFILILFLIFLPQIYYLYRKKTYLDLKNGSRFFIKEESNDIRCRATDYIDLLKDAFLLMKIIDAVGVFNDKQGAMIILIHKEEFLKLIKACNGVRFTVQAYQAIISLKPISIVTGINNIINLIAG